MSCFLHLDQISHTFQRRELLNSPQEQDAVTEHDAYGVGVYHYFRDHEVRVPAAIRCPTGLEHRFRSPLTVFLNGRGTIQHVLNVRGNATGPKGGPGDVAHWCGAK